MKPMPGKLRARAPATITLDPRPEYQRVSVTLSNGDSLATVKSTGNQISSRLPSLSAANGLLILPPRTEEKIQVQEGEEVECLIIGPLLSEMNFI